MNPGDPSNGGEEFKQKYRRLDERQIALTLTRLRDRIAERFPGSGLSHVADELRQLGDETS